MAGLTICTVPTVPSEPTFEEFGIAPFPQIFEVSDPSPVDDALIQWLAYYDPVSGNFIYTDHIPGFVNLPIQTTTDSDGLGVLCMPSGTYILRVSAPSHYPQVITITVTEGNTWPIRLSKVPPIILTLEGE